MVLCRGTHAAGGGDGGKDKGGFFSKKAKPPKATRRKREEEGVEQYALNRFNPLLLDILEDLAAGRLSEQDFPYARYVPGVVCVCLCVCACVRVHLGGTTTTTSSVMGSHPRSPRSYRMQLYGRMHMYGMRRQPSEDPGAAAQAASARTARSGLNWARRGQGEGSGTATGRRLVVFIIGGATHSEMRVVHRMAAQTGRDVILGSTSVETPHSFLEALYQVSSVE